MRFKTYVSQEAQHKDFVCCVGWNTTEDVYSCGDDHVLLKWNLVTKEVVKVADLPSDIFPTDLHWLPRAHSSNRKAGLDLVLITAADGKFHLVNKSGRIEKSVEAHKGATLGGCWSYDGAGLLTAGEDGHVKVWSRSGMLRSTVVQGGQPIYSAVWGPDSNQVLHTLGNMLVIKSLAPNTKPNKWKAHDGLILKVAWNLSNNLIISGGEDCHYKVWDTYGRPMYNSSVHDYPITSLCWAPAGDMFAVGSYNMLRLCDKLGWSHSLDKPNVGSIYNLAWSSDGTQVAGACASGHVITAHIVDRHQHWSNYEAIITSRKKIMVKDITSNMMETLEFPDRIIKMELGFGHLVAVLPSQCYIYRTNNWNTPVIFDLREGSVSMLILVQRHLLLVEKTVVGLYSYEGRLLCSPRWPNMQLDLLNLACITVSPDTIAVRDQTDDKLVHLFSVGSGRPLVELPPLRHSHGLIEIALNQAGLLVDRQIALVDKNRDLHISTVGVSASRKHSKLGTMIESLCWNTETNMLGAVQDNNVTVWYYPNVVFVDKSLSQKTAMVRDGSEEFGKNPVVVSFVENLLSIRKADGTMMHIAVSTYFTVLHGFAAAGRWDDALRLSRAIKDLTLWACLAAMAIHAKNMEAAEEAYAAINDLDRVEYLLNIKEIKLRPLQTALMTLLSGNVWDSESILMQNGLIFRAIMVNMEFHNWDRALDLAMKHKTHVDTVLYYRQKYLDAFEKVETNNKFLQFKNQIELDPEKIEAKVQLELRQEKDGL